MKRFLLSENNIKNIEEIQTNTAKITIFPPKYLSIKTGSIKSKNESYTSILRPSFLSLKLGIWNDNPALCQQV